MTAGIVTSKSHAGPAGLASAGLEELRARLHWELMLSTSHPDSC